MVELNPDSLIALNNTSSTLHDLGRYGEANKYADKALEVNPDSLTAIHNKGKIIAKMGAQINAYLAPDMETADDPSATAGPADGDPSGGAEVGEAPEPKDLIRKTEYWKASLDRDLYMSRLRARNETHMHL